MLAVLSYTQQKGENKCNKQANVHKFPDMCPRAHIAFLVLNNNLTVLV